MRSQLQLIFFHYLADFATSKIVQYVSSREQMTAYLVHIEKADIM